MISRGPITLIYSILVVIGSVFICYPAKCESEPREALRYSTDKSWYDYESDSLVFPNPNELNARVDKLENRNDRVVNKAQPVPTKANNSFDFLESIWDFGASLYNVAWLRQLLWMIIAIALAAVVLYVLRRTDFGGYRLRKNRNGIAQDSSARDQARMMDLPFPIQHLHTNLWNEVLRLRDTGEFSQAIVYLYCHTLVELDAANCIRLQRGKTNRAYLRELKSRPELLHLHESLMNCFEFVFFGSHSVDRSKFEQSMATAMELKKLLAIGDKLPANVANTVATVNLTSWLLLIICMSTFTVGCNAGRIDRDSLYGESATYGAKESIAGLSAFRALCEKNGQTSIQLRELSRRSRDLDTIVLAPKSMRAPSTAEVEWFEAWLTENPNRSLIFIGRDFSPSVRYWKSAIQTEDSFGRIVFANEKAFAETLHEELWWKNTDSLDCDWFHFSSQRSETTNGGQANGKWVSESKSAELNIPLRGHFEPMTSNHNEEEFESLVETEDGRPFLFSLQSTSWNGGRIFVFANGAILLNEGMTYAGHRDLAQRLIATLPKNGRIGFLSPQGETMIRSDTDKQDASGFELLRVWPLSLISIQALFIGFIALLALFPIFGRPQRLAKVSTADFGLHIQALGQLLQKTQDKNYALHQIASYFRDVKREPNHPWAQAAPPSKEFTNDRVAKDRAL